METISYIMIAVCVFSAIGTAWCIKSIIQNLKTYKDAEESIFEKERCDKARRDPRHEATGSGCACQGEETLQEKRTIPDKGREYMDKRGNARNPKGD